jgi:hypothetical protein
MQENRDGHVKSCSMKLSLARRYLLNMGMILASLVGVLLVAFFSGLDVSSPIAIVGTLLSLACAVALAWSIRKYQVTELSDEGASQLTLNGIVFVPWNDVSEVNMYSGAFILIAPQGKIIIYPKAYEQPEDVSDCVVTHMRQVMQARGARVARQPKTFS